MHAKNSDYHVFRGSPGQDISNAARVNWATKSDKNKQYPVKRIYSESRHSR